MDLISDPKYLKQEQYRQGNRLDARVQLHRKFSVNPVIYFEWMFDLVKIGEGMQVLEIGCGTGEFWRTNLTRLPKGLKPILADLSAGMVASARTILQNASPYSFCAADAQDLPFSTGYFDRVLANYMLYHVPDIPRSISELRRVLKTGGVLCAATNGMNHMVELYNVLQQFGVSGASLPSFTARYGLENAPALLGSSFEHVQVIPFVDHLFITETAPLMAYIRSMTGFWHLASDAEMELEKWVASEISHKGGFTITKSSGVVLAF